MYVCMYVYMYVCLYVCMHYVCIEFNIVTSECFDVGAVLLHMARIVHRHKGHEQEPREASVPSTWALAFIRRGWC